MTWAAFAIGVLWLAAGGWAQPAPFPLMHGTLLEADSHTDSGEFSVRGTDNEVFRFRYDLSTHVEIVGSPAAIRLLKPGEWIDVESDAIADSPLRYARSVIAPHPLAPAKPAPRPRARTSSLATAATTTQLDSLLPRTELTFSGVVSYRADGRFILHTRNSGDQTILLRHDTRYLSDGSIAGGSDLKANMRVFVRAGKDLFGHTEAYQVMWGGFLQPGF